MKVQIKMEDYNTIGRQGRFLNPVERIGVVKNLREQAGGPKTRQVGRLIESEADLSPYTPTIGIEIEVPQEAILPPEAEDWKNTRLRDYLKKQREKYRMTISLGIPEGEVAPRSEHEWWEFAFRPARHYLTISREVQALLDTNHLNRGYGRYPLHVTLGGIRYDDNIGDTLTLARGLEATAWATNSARLQDPFTRIPAWNHKGIAGVEEVDDLLPKKTTGIELRVFQLQKLSDLNRLLNAAFFLGTALKASQDKKNKAKLTRGQNKEVLSDLAQVWDFYVDYMDDHFTRFGLKSPRKVDPWNKPTAVQGNGFVGFTKLLADAEMDPGGRGSQFVDGAREIVGKARAEVKDLIA